MVLSQFLIQADFVTSANRESVVDCPWNLAICGGVKVAFTQAIKAFATANHPLRHEWPKYLPSSPMEKPWNCLYQGIVDILGTMPVLETWEQRSFKSPSELRMIPRNCLCQGNPIFQDLQEEIYLAPEYRLFDTRILADLGVRFLDWSHILTRLQADLTRETSRIRNRERNSSWYEAFAELGTSGLKFGNRTSSRLKKMALICLNKPNQWTGAPGESKGGLRTIYFPATESIPIPSDIGYYLADETASSNKTVRKFYEAMGVKECPKEIVFAAIKAAQGATTYDLDLLLDLHVHLTYLYHLHGQPSKLRDWVHIPTDSGYARCDREFYLASDNAYHLDQLLSHKLRSRKKLECNLVTADFLRANSSRRSYLFPERIWQSWVQKVTNARYYPPLTRQTGDKVYLHHDLENILKYNPSKFLGTLHAHWSEYRNAAWQISEHLRDCQVLCQSGLSHPLHFTYLPTSHILETAQEFGLSGSQVPILVLSVEKLSHEQYLEWRFLEEFGACPKPDLAFYQTALEELSQRKDVSLEKLQLLYKSMAVLVTYRDYENLRLVEQLVSCVFR
jgi:hypothetical protein